MVCSVCSVFADMSVIVRVTVSFGMSVFRDLQLLCLWHIFTLSFFALSMSRMSRVCNTVAKVVREPKAVLVSFFTRRSSCVYMPQEVVYQPWKQISKKHLHVPGVFAPSGLALPQDLEGAFSSLTVVT